MIIMLIKLSIKCMKLVGYAMYYTMLAVFSFFALIPKIIYEIGK